MVKMTTRNKCAITWTCQFELVLGVVVLCLVGPILPEGLLQKVNCLVNVLITTEFRFGFEKSLIRTTVILSIMIEYSSLKSQVLYKN